MHWYRLFLEPNRKLSRSYNWIFWKQPETSQAYTAKALVFLFLVLQKKLFSHTVFEYFIANLLKKLKVVKIQYVLP